MNPLRRRRRQKQPTLERVESEARCVAALVDMLGELPPRYTILAFFILSAPPLCHPVPVVARAIAQSEFRVACARERFLEVLRARARGGGSTEGRPADD